MMVRYLFFLSLCTSVFLCKPLYAQHNKKVIVKGLKDSVRVHTDNWGINHIYANNEYDLFFTQGYTAAKDRLFQFEMWRREATGTVSEILGPSELKRDIGLRLLKYRGDLKKDLAYYHPNGQSIINAYVDGVNAYIDEINQTPELLPIEFKKLKIKPQKWTVEIVISRHQGVFGNIQDELRIGRAAAAGEAKSVSELMYFHPNQPNLTLDKSITKEMLSHNILELYNESHKPIKFNKEHTPYIEVKETEETNEGSNNWVVAGNKTDSGFPHLANDPHRGILLPSLRYIVHLVAPGWNVIGGGEPVKPGVSIGHNELGGWGLTIFRTDFEDLYVYDLNPKKLSQYKYKGKWVEMNTIQESISIKGKKAQKIDLRYTKHGPVLYIDSIHKKGYAMRAAWLEPGGAPYLASLRFNQAKNWEEFREACKYSHIPGENMIWADKNGDIGWQVVGLAPVRKNFSGMVPVPGDGRFEWDGFLPMLERPNSFKPQQGFIATANQNVVPADYKHMETVNYLWVDPFRGDRINELLSDKNKVTLQDHQDFQMDYFSIPARELVPMIKGVKFEKEIVNEALQRIGSWDYRLEPNSVAAGIYNMWENKILEEAKTTLIPSSLKGLVNNIQLVKLITWLKASENGVSLEYNPIKNSRSFLMLTFEKAVTELVGKLGEDPQKWQYGQANYKHIKLTHPLDYFLTDEQRSNTNMGPLPRGGNSETLNQTNRGDNQSSGASFRVIMDTADWDKTIMTNSPGQSGNPESKFYKNLFEGWAQDKYFPAYFSKDKILSNTYESVLLIGK